MRTIRERVYQKKISQYETLRVYARIQGTNHVYFSITADLYDSRERRENGLVSCGMNHELVLKHFPELAYLTECHLIDGSGIPMHYIANSLYWLGFSEYAEYNERAFMNTCAWGFCPDDFDFTPDEVSKMDEERAKQWLISRLEEVQKEFFSRMVKCFGTEVISRKEIQ